jgi:hypothetical protein
VFATGGGAERDDVRVLEEQQLVGDLAGPPPRHELLLQLERGGVQTIPSRCTCSRRGGSGVFGKAVEDGLESGQEACGIGAIDNAVIVTEREQCAFADGNDIGAVASIATGFFSIAPVPRIAAVPSGMMGMPTTVPSTPGLVIENVAPWISSGLSFRSRARCAEVGDATRHAGEVEFIVPDHWR